MPSGFCVQLEVVLVSRKQIRSPKRLIFESTSIREFICEFLIGMKECAIHSLASIARKEEHQY